MKKFFAALWKMMRSNPAIKIMAVLFAVILWSYVLADTNPPRDRTISNITVSYTGTEALRAKGLAVAGNLSDALQKVDVRVEINQNDLKYFNNDGVRAEVDLSTVSGAGNPRLEITAKTTYGKVLSVSPSEVTLTVDSYVTKTIPVTVGKTGLLPSGYYASEPQIQPSVISISGAASDIAKVSSASCSVDLSGLTQDFSQSVDVELLDSKGNAVNGELFYGDYPSVVASFKVMHMKVVPVDAQGPMTGQDNLAPGYQVESITCDPQYVTVVSYDKAALDSLQSVPVMSYSVGGYSMDYIAQLDYVPPEGMRVLEYNKAQVVVTIREKTDKASYTGIPIIVKNLSSGLDATVDPASVDVMVNAGILNLSRLYKSDVLPYVDADGLEPGTYSLNIMFELPDGFVQENFTPSTVTVTVTIKKK